MDQTTVLYVIPVYNAENWLDECIQSILSQEGNLNILIYCIDDGSTDGSTALLEGYASNCKKFSYTTQKNSGPGAAFNKGIAYARKLNIKFIARMDADDVSLPFRTEKQLKVLIDNPQVGACSCSAEYFMESKGSVGKSIVPTLPDEIKAEINAGGRGLIQGATLFRTDALAVVEGYRAKKTPAEDTDIFLRLSEYCSLMNIPSVEYRIRICERSHSLGDIGYTRVYHHYYLELARLRKMNKAEISYEDYVKSQSLRARLAIKREATSMRAYFLWMTRGSYISLGIAALCDMRRTCRRIGKKLKVHS
jgi:glycosyltransferase involved in cell wall biosynthesis